MKPYYLLALIIASNTTYAASLTVEGEIRTSSGGVVFPDGTTQMTAVQPYHSSLCSKVTSASSLTCSSEINPVLDVSTPSQIGGSCAAGDCYPCGNPDKDLPQIYGEHIYSFRCQTTGLVTVNLINVACDLDLYVLESNCGFFSGTGQVGCIAGDTSAGTNPSSATFHCSDGVEYHVVVENTLDSPSCGYELLFDVGDATGCHEHCANAIDDDLDALVDCNDPDCSTDPICSTP